LFSVWPEEQVQEVIWRRLKTKGPAKARLELLKQAEQLSNIPAFNALLNRGRSGLRPLERLIAQSGAEMKLGTFLLISGLCGLVIAFVVVKLTGMVLAAVPAGVFASSLPTSVLRFKATRRVLKFEEQFPEALALISRALKAGHTFTTGLSVVYEKFQAALCTRVQR